MNTTALPNRSSSRQRGITLVEACIVMAVIVVVAGAAMPGLQQVIEARRLDGAATQLAADIQFVRTEAVARNEPLRLSFQSVAGAACYVVHTGPAGACTCGASVAAACSGAALAVKTVSLPVADGVGLDSNVASMLFDPVHGTATPTGTVRVLGARERAVHHVINVMGRVRSCSPRAVTPGYRAC